MKVALAGYEASVDDLNITPFVDVFAVITMFLLLSYSATNNVARPLSDVALPLSAEGVSGSEMVRVSVSRVGVRIENQLVMGLEGGQPAAGDVDEVRRIVPLFEALQREKLRLLSAPLSQVELDTQAAYADTLYLEVARGLPYGLVDKILNTAAAAGFGQFRLAVYRKE